MSEYDLFDVYRWLLLVILSIYSILVIGSSILGAARAVSGVAPHQRLLRTYLTYQLLTIRLRPAAGELRQIAAWLALLLVIWYAHQWL